MTEIFVYSERLHPFADLPLEEMPPKPPAKAGGKSAAYPAAAPFVVPACPMRPTVALPPCQLMPQHGAAINAASVVVARLPSAAALLVTLPRVYQLHSRVGAADIAPPAVGTATEREDAGSSPSAGLPVSSVAAGAEHVLLVAHGRLFGLGSNEYLQCGAMDADAASRSWNDMTPSLTRAVAKQENGAASCEEPSVRVLSAAAGSCHSIVIALVQADHRGAAGIGRRRPTYVDVYTTGYAKDGALGHSDAPGATLCDWHPLESLRAEGCDKVWACDTLSFVRGTRGLFAFGTFGTRGGYPAGSTVAAPRLILPAEQGCVTDVAVTESDVYLLVSDVRIFAFCCHSPFPALGGTAEPRARAATPSSQAAAVQNFLASSCRFDDVTETTLGPALTSQAASPLVHAKAPAKTTALPSSSHPCHVLSLSAGKQHCVAVLSDGRAVGWGANTFGQLGGAASTVNGRVLLPPWGRSQTAPGKDLPARPPSNASTRSSTPPNMPSLGATARAMTVAAALAAERPTSPSSTVAPTPSCVTAVCGPFCTLWLDSAGGTHCVGQKHSSVPQSD